MTDKHWSDRGSYTKEFEAAKERTTPAGQQETTQGDQSRKAPEHGLQNGPKPPEFARTAEGQREAMEAARERSFAKAREEMYNKEHAKGMIKQQEQDRGDRGRG